MARKKRSKQPSQVPPLDERHYIAMDLMIKGPYYDAKVGRNRWLNRGEIAEAVGISRMQLHRWEQRKDFQHEKDKRSRAYRLRRYSKQKSYADLALSGDASAYITLLNALQG